MESDDRQNTTADLSAICLWKNLKNKCKKTAWRLILFFKILYHLMVNHPLTPSFNVVHLVIFPPPPLLFLIRSITNITMAVVFEEVGVGWVGTGWRYAW